KIATARGRPVHGGARRPDRRADGSRSRSAYCRRRKKRPRSRLTPIGLGGYWVVDLILGKQYAPAGDWLPDGQLTLLLHGPSNEMRRCTSSASGLSPPHVDIAAPAPPRS